jgi:uncharacterized membrane protein
MRGFWLLVHVLGFTLWIGGGLASMVAGVAAKRFAAPERLKAYRLIGAVQRLLVGPGAAGVLVSGVLLLLGGPYMHEESGMMPGWLSAMMGAGGLGAIVAIVVSVPTAARLGRLEPTAEGDVPEAFLRLRKRQIISATIAGSLGLIAMFAATLGR